MNILKPFLFLAAVFISMLSMANDLNDAEAFEESCFSVSTAVSMNFLNTTCIESETTQLDHKYYLSVSNVKYSEKAKALQMTSRFFIDDLEDVLNERMDQKVVLGNPKGLTDLKPILNRYISQRLQITADGERLESVVIGAEYDADQIIVYIEMPALKEPKSVEMSFKALFELFPEQKNLVHFKIRDQRKSLLNSMDTPKDRIKF